MTQFFRKFTQNLAQNVLEYCLILALVAGGIMLGAPYVRRSWNAYIKSLEEGIDDSYHDPYDRSPGIDMPCSCGPVYGQPPDTCGFGPCSVFEYRRARDCFPFGCDDDLNQCIPDPSCCSDWIPDDCGTRVTHADPCRQNEMAYWRKCGDGRIESKCERDTRCGVSCYGEDANGQPADPNSDGWCYPGQHDIYLTTAQPVFYVNPPGHINCPPSAFEAQCIAKCKEGYQSTGTGCEYVPCDIVVETYHINDALRSECPQLRQTGKGGTCGLRHNIPTTLEICRIITGHREVVNTGSKKWDSPGDNCVKAFNYAGNYWYNTNSNQQWTTWISCRFCKPRTGFQKCTY